MIISEKGSGDWFTEIYRAISPFVSSTGEFSIIPFKEELTTAVKGTEFESAFQDAIDTTEKEIDKTVDIIKSITSPTAFLTERKTEIKKIVNNSIIQKKSKLQDYNIYAMGGRGFSVPNNFMEIIENDIQLKSIWNAYNSNREIANNYVNDFLIMYDNAINEIDKAIDNIPADQLLQTTWSRFNAEEYANAVIVALEIPEPKYEELDKINETNKMLIENLFKTLESNYIITSDYNYVRKTIAEPVAVKTETKKTPTAPVIVSVGAILLTLLGGKL